MELAEDAFRRPYSARVYDYLLGGKDNYAADREAAEEILRAFPQARIGARANRAFMHRAAHFLAAEVGIRQFLDIGTGIPTEPNLHQVAQAVAPESRVMYVDNDPIVLAHARALMDSTPEGRCAFVGADVTEPNAILNAPELEGTLDLSQPVALSFVALLHFVTDEDDAHGIVARLLSVLPSGSALVISHGTADIAPEAIKKGREVYKQGGINTQLRTKAEVAQFFTGLELVEPGIVLPHRWRPDTSLPTVGSKLRDEDAPGWAGVAVKP